MMKASVASKLTKANHPVACPPQWLPVLLTANTPGPPTNHRRLLSVFTTKAELKTAAAEYNADVTAAELQYGAIADWDVSAIADMNSLFYGLIYFNADISSWDTTSVTDMRSMFLVRFRLRLLPPLPSWCHTHAACAADSPFPQLRHISVPHAFPSDGCPF
jgi:surface protein